MKAIIYNDEKRKKNWVKLKALGGLLKFTHYQSRNRQSSQYILFICMPQNTMDYKM